MIEPGIFKKYDIRGKVGDTLTEAGATQIGQAFGTFLRRHNIRDVIVGHDNRTSSRALADAAIQGLMRAGCEVTDIGLAATPVVYWCAVEAGDAGGMMITGSHLKPEMNGFKLSVGMRNLYGDQIQALRQMIDSGDLTVGEGHSAADDRANERYLAMAEGKLSHARA
ncbi:MAG: phosphomannomutase, partial [Chloroflexi bacterium]|nr:phosphomannomutase [Chloroflexota bacterium]